MPRTPGSAKLNPQIKWPFWLQGTPTAPTPTGPSLTNGENVLTSSIDGLAQPQQRKTFAAVGRDWLFYFTNPSGTPSLYFTSSTDGGSTWNTPVVFKSLPGYPFGDGRYFDTHFDGTHLHYAVGGGDGWPLTYRMGTPNSDGTISWAAVEQTVLANGGGSGAHLIETSINCDSNGNPWIMVESFLGTPPATPTVFKSSTSNGTWTDDTANSFPFEISGTITYNWPIIAPLNASGAMLALYYYIDSGSGNTGIWSLIWDGAAWGFEVQADVFPVHELEQETVSMVTDPATSRAFVAYNADGGQGVFAAIFDGAWIQEPIDPSSAQAVTIGFDDVDGSVYAIMLHSGTDLYSSKRDSATSIWSTPTLLESVPAGILPTSVQISERAVNNHLVYAYADTLGNIRAREIATAAGGSHTIAVGQVTESDTSQALSRIKRKAIGQPSEADTSQSFTHRKIKAIGQPSEADTSQSMTHRKIKILGQPSETDSPQTITRKLGLTVAMGQTLETDTSQSMTSRKIKAIGQSSESDASQAMTHKKIKAIGQPNEADSTQAIRAQKSRILGQPNEADSATAWKTPAKIQIVTEVDLSQAFNRIKIKTIGQPSESDTSQSFTKRKTKTLGQPSESDISLAFNRRKIRIIGQPSEADSSQSISGFLAHFVNQAVENDTSQSFKRIKIKVIGLNTEADTSQSFGRAKRRILGQPTETDLSQPIKNQLRMNIINEVDTSQSFTRIKRRTIGLPIETDTSQPMLRRKIRIIGMNFETDLSQPMLKKHRRIIGLPTETDSVTIMRPARGDALSQVIELDTALTISTIGIQLSYTPRELGMRVRGNDVRVKIHGGSRGKIRGSN